MNINCMRIIKLPLNFTRHFISIFIFLLLITNSLPVYADEITDNTINYLKSQQDSTGKINGWGGESQWAAIAFARFGVDVGTIKNPTVSLKDFLFSDTPTDTAPATEWERRILAIVAIGEDPTNFNNVNYMLKLESYANNNQLGEVTQINDDIFGLLALIASGSNANVQLKQDILSFIISRQNADGGFSWTTNPSLNTSDSNDTAAALQALQAAKETGMVHTNLDTAIDTAKNYLLSLQNSDGGFRYDNSLWSSNSDGSSTAWSLMALNELGMSESTQANNAKAWLGNNQESDGGFHWMIGYGSDTATTSHAAIALSGSGWLSIYVFTPTPTVSLTPTVVTPTPTPSLTLTLTPTPTPTVTSTPTPTAAPTATPTNTPTPTPTLTPTVIVLATTPTSIPEVLGTTFKNPVKHTETQPSQTPSTAPSPLSITHQQPFPVQKGLKGFSLVSLLSAVGYWYFKLRV